MRCAPTHVQGGGRTAGGSPLYDAPHTGTRFGNAVGRYTGGGSCWQLLRASRRRRLAAALRCSPKLYQAVLSMQHVPYARLAG